MTKTRRQRVEAVLKVSLGIFFLTTLWMGAQLHKEDVITVSDAIGNNQRPAAAAAPGGNNSIDQRAVRRPPPRGPDLPPSNDNSSNATLWRANPNIPPWLQDYMDWHRNVVSTQLTGHNWHRYRYLVLRCYRFDERCGGVSDRLKPVPLLLLAAARSNRVFFIHWDRPFPLEEFLEPPPGGLNWSVPQFLVEEVKKHQKGAMTRATQVLEGASRDDGMVKMVHIHDALGGSVQYDEVMGKGAFSAVFHDLFRFLFRPSPGLRRQIDGRQLHGGAGTAAAALPPGRYSVAHYRAEYGREVGRHPKLTEPAFIRKVALNSLRCAIQLQPGDPIYFASDNIVALRAVREHALQTGYPIYTFDRDEDVVLKLDDYGDIDRGNKSDTTTASSSGGLSPIRPSDYYSTFVDLYLAGSGTCVTFGRGGFGRFASLLSFNSSCAFKHVKQFYPVPCMGSPPLYKTRTELRREGLRVKPDSPPGQQQQQQQLEEGEGVAGEAEDER
jgi:hypothetical protein